MSLSKAMEVTEVWWFVKSKTFGCAVATDKNKIIVITPPLLRKFLGQPLDNLCNWGPVTSVTVLKATVVLDVS